MEHHSRGLKKLLVSQGWGDEKIDDHVTQIIADFNKAEIDPLDKAVLGYARKLTIDPSSINKTDIDELRKKGVGDTAIHDLCAIVSYFNFVNRIADGLGVELENLAN